MRKCTKLWTKRDGTKIRICDMSDSHVANTIKMLERAAEYECQNAISAGYSVLSIIQGEMAEYHIENDIRHLEDYGIDPKEISPLYEDLCKDMYRRESDEQRLVARPRFCELVG